MKEKDLEIAQLKHPVMQAMITSNNGNELSNHSVAISSKDAEMKAKLQAKRLEKELDSLRERLQLLERELEERRIVENNIYATDMEFDEEKAIPTRLSLLNHLISLLVAY